MEDVGLTSLSEKCLGGIRGRRWNKIDQRISDAGAKKQSAWQQQNPLNENYPICRGVRPGCLQEASQAASCPDCLALQKQAFQASEDLNFLLLCRALRLQLNQGVRSLPCPFVAAFIVTPSGRFLDVEADSAAFLRSGRPLAIRHNHICACDPDFNEVLLNAIARVSHSRAPETLVCGTRTPHKFRLSILLQPIARAQAINAEQDWNVACLVFPLGRRRIASVRQLMSMFGLSAAEARLARALCHGDTLEEYAQTQGVKITTIKTQLRSVFAKTQTDRQVTLVSLITGIPPLR